MITCGAFEAKTHLLALLDKVAAGEEVTITWHGRPIARLVKADTAARQNTDEINARLKTLRSGSVLGMDWKALRDDGRR